MLDRSASTLEHETSPDGQHRTRADEDPLGCTSPSTAERETARALDHGLGGSELALPFEPSSFRDSVVFEEHCVGAARGCTDRFRPVVAGVGPIDHEILPAVR